MSATCGADHFSPEAAVTVLRGVGPKRAERLRALGIRTLEDLLRHAPRTYEDRGPLRSIAELAYLPPGSFVALRGRVAASRLLRRGRKRSLLRALLEDATGRIELLWFQAPFLARVVAPGSAIAVSGRLSRERRALLHPEVTRIAAPDAPFPEDLLGLRPRYPSTEGLNQRLLGELVGEALGVLGEVVEPLPDPVRRAAGVAPLGWAMRAAHQPRTREEAERGRERLLFDELLRVELALARRRRERRMHRGPRTSRAGGGAEAFVRALPFRLTPSQRRALEEIVEELGEEHPMARMLAGEVGSGKTVVALAAIEEARSRGLQCAFLAPTDLLARQHHRCALSLLPRAGAGVVLVSGSLPPSEASEARRRLERGEADFAIGTHALLTEQTRFRSLGLVVVDEEHRFGVEQRDMLLRKARAVHSLAMTATPIPRSLALLAFGDQDLSQLELRPGARGEVVTRLVPAGRRGAALRWVRRRLLQGEQAFFVRPRIEGERAGARELHEELLRGVLRGLEVGLVHGRLPAAEREEMLERFQRGAIPAIVTTTLVEVGLDVPGAAILWVEGAERLGLAQLHQLRGRIARRGQRGYCWLVEGSDAPEGSRERLETLVEIQDGMRLAEIDLALRGPGELLGLRQSGWSGAFAGMGPGASRRLAELAERAWRAAESLLESAESSGAKEGSRCRRELAGSIESPLC